MELLLEEYWARANARELRNTLMDDVLAIASIGAEFPISGDHLTRLID